MAEAFLWFGAALVIDIIQKTFF